MAALLPVLRQCYVNAALLLRYTKRPPKKLGGPDNCIVCDISNKSPQSFMNRNSVVGIEWIC